MFVFWKLMFWHRAQSYYPTQVSGEKINAKKSVYISTYLWCILLFVFAVFLFLFTKR
jgi:hypothetical protein